MKNTLPKEAYLLGDCDAGTHWILTFSLDLNFVKEAYQHLGSFYLQGIPAAIWWLQLQAKNENEWEWGANEDSYELRKVPPDSFVDYFKLCIYIFDQVPTFQVTW